MKKLTLVVLIVLAAFLIGATPPPPKKQPANTGTYKVSDKHKNSGKKGVGGICFIDTSQY